MNTRKYSMSFRLTSPMQVGAGQRGMIEHSRLCVPGRLVWAAMTKAIAEEAFDDYSAEHYIEAGEALGGPGGSNFSTFFLSLDGERPIIPCCEDGGLQWKTVERGDNGLVFAKNMEWPDAEFRAMTVSSEAAQSTEPHRMATREESLHEIMLVQPLVRHNNKIQPLYLVGAFRLPEPLVVGGRELDMAWIEENVLARISLGGGRARGRGRLDAGLPGREAPTGRLPDGSLDYLLADILEVGSRRILLRDMPLSDARMDINGHARLAIYRQWDNAEGGGMSKGAGRSIRHVGLCWEPGSTA